jgi:amidohydrolase
LAFSQIHTNPELGYAEFKAHSNIVSLLQSYDIPTTPHAYGIPTSFEAEFGNGGKVLTYCAEYDALPGIGHACSHNLIGTASIASFLAVAHALKVSKIPGCLRLLGTPAEEGGGGKIQLIEAGAFKDVDAALMIHPTNPRSDGRNGVSYGTCLASQNFRAIFKEEAAHAASQPVSNIYPTSTRYYSHAYILVEWH